VGWVGPVCCVEALVGGLNRQLSFGSIPRYEVLFSPVLCVEDIFYSACHDTVQLPMFSVGQLVLCQSLCLQLWVLGGAGGGV
jgi:hypothetical protein